MRRATLTSLAVLFLTTTAAFAQDETARKMATEVAARVPFEKAATGAPYSADTIVESAQALADGNRIVRKTVGHVYRDSEGRTRREDESSSGRAFATAQGNVTPYAFKRTMVSIVDPVGGFSYSLDAENKIAWRTPIGASASIMGKVEAAQVEGRRVEMERSMADGKPMVARKETPMTDEEKEKIARELQAVAAAGGGRARGGSGSGEMIPRSRGSVANMPETPLEHKTLEGIAVEGRKTTTVIPAGQVGNEQPLTIVSEEWRSPDLNVLVMTRHSDPRTGESTYRLTNIVRAEPDRSLFMVPADYTVKETGIRRMLEAPRRQ